MIKEYMQKKDPGWRYKDLMDILVVYGCFGALFWFIFTPTEWLLWLILAIIIHFCYASRLHFELKHRKVQALKKYVKSKAS